MKQRQDTNVFVLGVAPRLATNQNPSLDKEINSLNNFIRCSYENQPATAKMFQFVSLQRFFAGNFRFLLEQDGVHVNEKGIKNLIRIIHHRVLRINLLPNKSRKAKKLSHKRFNKSVLWTCGVIKSNKNVYDGIPGIYMHLLRASDLSTYLVVQKTLQK